MLYELYLIPCLTPGHFYVGITSNWQSRVENHTSRPGRAFVLRHGPGPIIKIGTNLPVELAKGLEKSITSSMNAWADYRVAGGPYTSERAIDLLKQHLSPLQPPLLHATKASNAPNRDGAERRPGQEFLRRLTETFGLIPPEYALPIPDPPDERDGVSFP